MYPALFTTRGVKAFAEAIDTERQAQLAKFGEQKHPDGTGLPGDQGQADIARRICQKAADGGTLAWRHILQEEVREALAESDLVRLRAELVQVAAVAAAWARDIDTRPHPMICAHCEQPIPVDPHGHTWHGPVPLPGQPACTVPRYHLGVEYPECRKAGGATA
ncbi:hypothetical protein J3A78_003841 [Streptomyces sp. PvR006]|uniref:hypothetical protein n=1 Tax=Streptomyces sp. PvR006 TaxID=2817860 RepID=UPI001AE25A86|nr:hypothetical protein [Streptomyces sp. PvR006]MBP2583363.1 hypothetical protein [Streptomyces sp. PvR006]